MKTFKQILTEKEIKKDQKVIVTKSGKNGKIIAVSGDKSMITIKFNDGKELEILAKKLTKSSGPYKKDYDYEL